DVIVATALPTGARVRVYSGPTGERIADFPVNGAAFQAGLSVTAVDLTHDGKAEVVVGAAGSSEVRTYDPFTGTLLPGPLGSFAAFAKGYKGGVFVAADNLGGDVDGDGTPDLAVGTDSGQSKVRVVSGATGKVLQDLTPFGKN